MKNNTNNKCTSVRKWLFKAVSKHAGFDAEWIQNHVASCPRCQRRLAAAGRVDAAFSLIKSQPHNLDLLMRANEQAVNVLKHSLRYSAKADKLKCALPKPKISERCLKYRNSALNAAACLAILFLMKTGVFSSMDKFQSEGQKVIKNYYASRVGQEMADDIFPT
ncbi:MAG: hypothetical protein H8D47_01315 [Planctomycetes bacterium]|nr:hypothetical protein [Planctomycetota bacterium]